MLFELNVMQYRKVNMWMVELTLCSITCLFYVLKHVVDID